ncbi:Liver carboxylesterase 1 [Termitomyces sp. T112]|nr:Liver carboxylesterase 1 [Termitomyces sp. T112]
MWFSLSGIIISSLVPNVFTQKATDPIVDTGYAKYLGNRTFPNTVAFLGIPYAEPPLGERRFRKPLPLDTVRVSLEASGAVINATFYPAFCIQGAKDGKAGGAGSEDCLKLNIYTPADAKNGSNLPVLVYIHGGGYTFGTPANWPFDHWIRQSPNVVIVSVYYRLSSFGFLALPEFEDPQLGDFNAGFLDQTEALRWVKSHIASFGGNPNKITINGQSAGGSSVELHLIANKDAELFTGAIAQSVYRTPLPTPEQQQPLFQFYAQYAGCGSGSTMEQLACLRSASVSALARAQDAGSSSTFTGSPYKTFHPVLDGKIFTEFPTQSITSGKFASVPLIVGATTNETLAIGNTIPAALMHYCPLLTAADIAILEEAYSGSDFADDLRKQTLTGDVSVRCARTIMATNFSDHVPAWTYRYNQRNPTDPPSYGVAHSAENWMMFLGTKLGANGTTTFTPMTPIQDAFASELIAYWLSFVRSGNPNTYKLSRSPVWPSYSAEERSRIVLQQAATLTASGSFVEEEVEPETHRCELIASQATYQQN